MTSTNRLIAIALIVSFAGISCATPHGASRLGEGKTYDRYVGMWVYGFRRGYRVHIPPRSERQAALPLVVAIHGAFDSPRNFAEVTGLDEVADRHGFAVAYPAGFAPPLRTWNAGHCCGLVATLGVDDIGYIDAVIRDAQAHLEIDPSRIYLVGHSNGGMLIHRYLAERPGRVAAAAVVAGTIGGRRAPDEPEWRVGSSSESVPVLIVHGVMDEQVSYYGGADPRSSDGRTWVSARDSALHWSEGNDCTADPTTIEEHRAWVKREVWTGPTGCRVELHSLHGWGHRWPGHHYTSLLEADHPLRGFDVSESIAAFFRDSSITAMASAATPSLR